MMRILSILALTCLLCTSCYDASSELFFVDVNTDDLPNIEVLTNMIASDTIDNRDSIFFEYEILLDTGSIYFTQLFFNEKFILYSEQMTDSVWFDPHDTLSDGNYELYMEVIYKSSTGSLADRIDGEYLLLDTSWQIVFGEELVQ